MNEQTDTTKDDAQKSSSPSFAKEEYTGWGGKYVVIGALLTVQFINSGYNILTKLAVSKGGANPLVFSLYRDAFAYPILQLWAIPAEGWLLPERGDVWRMAVLGLTGMFGNQFLYILGLDLTSATIASIMNQAQPMIATAMAISLGMERLHCGKIAGFGLAALGAGVMVGLLHKMGIPRVVIVHGKEDSDDGGGSLSGYLCVLGSCVCMATYYIFQKPLLKKYPPISLTAWSYLFGAAIMGLAAAVMAAAQACIQGCVADPKEWGVSSETILALVFAVICNSVIKYAFQSFVNKYLEVSLLTAASTLVTFLTSFMDILCLGTSLHLSEVLGAIMILSGLALVTIYKDQPSAKGPLSPSPLTPHWARSAGGQPSKVDDTGDIEEEGRAEPLLGPSQPAAPAWGDGQAAPETPPLVPKCPVPDGGM